MALETPRFLQTKTYSAKALRAILLDGALQPGVMGGTDLMVVQRAAGTNMSVDVGAGAGWIKGSSTARQGLYDIYNDAAVNVGITTANGTNPRIDQIVARIYDTTDGGSAQDIATVEVVTGTATAGATLNNRTGVGALPAHTLLLADVLVGAGVTSITNANIRDRRPFARGYYDRIALPSQADLSVTTSYAAPAAAWQNIRVECTGNPIRCSTRARWQADGAGTVFVAFGVDGAFNDAGGALTDDLVGSSGSAVPGSGFASWDLLPTAGSHTITVYARGTVAGRVATNGVRSLLTIEELVRQNVANNSVTTG